MASQIDLYYATETSGGAHMKAGRMKPLAVTTENRMAAFPDLKTLAEYGYGKSMIGIWYGLFGPPRIPEAVLGRLSSELATLAQSEDYRSQLVKMGLDNAISSSEVMRLQIESEIPRWQQVARAAGVKQED
jgi:tripartite-type tricarboxylate transporter receptor subunit TctC